MNLQQIEVFLTAAETGSLTRTAEKLGYTQSRVTQIVKSLEDETGFALFQKGRSGTVLTDAAAELLPYFRRIMVDLMHLENSVSDLAGLRKGTIRIGSYVSCAMKWLPDIIRIFADKYPDIKFEITEAGRAQLISGIRDHLFDLVLTSEPGHESYDFIPAMLDPIVAVIPAGHELAGYDRIPVSALNDVPFVLSSVENDNDVVRVLKECGVRPDVRITSMSDTSIAMIVSSGIGVTALLPRLTLDRFRQDGYELRELDPPQYRSLGILVESLDTIGPITRKFIDIFTDLYIE